MIACELARCPYCHAALAPGAVEELPPDAVVNRKALRSWQPRHLPLEASPVPEAPPEALPPPPVPPVPPAIRPDIYRPTRTLAVALQLMFAAWMGLGGLVAAARIVEWRLVDRLASNPFAVGDEQAQAAFDRALRLGIVALAAYVVTGILFIVWLRRSYRNLLAFGVGRTRFPDGWAIGAWFVPIVSLYRPKQIVDECWRQSGSGPAGGTGYRRSAPVPTVLNLWWGLMIANEFLTTWFWVGSRDDPRNSGLANLWLSIGAVLLISAALAGFWVVTLVTRRQAERASRLLLDAPPRPVRRPAAWALSVVLPLAAVIVTVVHFIHWDQPPVFAIVEGDDQGETLRYDGYGISFEYPADYLAAESSGYGSGPPTDEFGVVALTHSSPALRDHVIVVEWDAGLTAADAEDAISAVVDMATSDLPGVPRIEVSGVNYLPFGTGQFVVRRFSATADDEGVSGAAGYGMCPSQKRLVGIRYVYDGANRYGTVFDNIASLLATLSC